MRIACLALIGLGLAAPVAAAPAPNLEALAGQISREAELADQNRRSEALNVQVNRANAQVQSRNAAAQAAYEAALAAYAQEKAAYEAALARHESDVAAYQAAQAKWKQQVAACQAGDVAGCAGEAITTAAR